MANRAVIAGIAVIPPLFVFNTDDSINRTIRFYSVAVPAYLHYELVDRVHAKSDKATREQVFTKLHDRYSPIMRDNVLRMRGFFLKAAQLMSIREDYLPPQYLEWTTQMQNEAPITFSSEEAKYIICDELKIKSISEIFSEFQDQPIGSASIGQVYRARLRESGKVVAVKVQSAGVEGQFRADLKSCKTFCQFALPHLVVPLEEIERQFMTEFDYSLEAKNLEEVRNNMISGGWSDRVVVPQPFHGLCTKRVLVMEFIEGKKVSDIFNQYIAELAEKQQKSPAEVKNELKSWILKQGLTNLSERRWHHRLVAWAHWVGRVVTLGIYSAGKSDPSVNPVDLLDTAMKAHAHQIFVNRAFNGDPHPGNLMLTPDGKLGLIDFGQVKRLSPERVEQFSRLVIALNDDDRDQICEIAKEIGCNNRHNIPDVVYRLTAFWIDRDTPDITLGLDIHKFLEEMERRDPQKELCQDLVMVSRCSVMLRSLGLSLGMRVRTSEYWRSYAEEYIAKYNSNFPG